MDSKACSSSSSSSSRTCLCSPTNHPGSFRCSLHRGGGVRRVSSRSVNSGNRSDQKKARSMRGLLMQIIRPSSHNLQRQRNFLPKPSRFCLMNDSEKVVAVA
ncbi:hypothetical protein J5N97_003153 [Dioscorea zingiberensis]|uniref:Serine-rich protein-like protein n=1 Tax=Dioscorea zingiberensis TaxID=325984 RepID=A0A9D5HR14_9LILI|nr:hypothetical protein J5N97_003153 [Dioscorea zingiberensis]